MAYVTAYPGAVDAYPFTTPGADRAGAVTESDSINRALIAAMAVETELGISPKGAAASVSARLTGIDATVTTTNANVATNTAAIATTNANVATVTSNVTANATAISNTNTAISNISVQGVKNRLVNGNFNVAQRGTGPFTAQGYTVDMWDNNLGSSTISTTLQTFPTGGIPGVVEAGNFLQCTVVSTAGASNYATIRNRIEGVKSLAGQVVTASFYAKASAILPVAFEFNQSFGTGGSSSAEITAIGATKLFLTTNWARYSVTFSVPSIASRVIGSNSNDFAYINMWMDSGSTYNTRSSSLGQQSGTFSFYGFQVEAASSATPLEQEHIQQTVAKCQRYFVRIPTDFTVGSGLGGSTTLVTRMLVNLPVVMRALPTVSGVGGGIQVFDGTNQVVLTSLGTIRFSGNLLSIEANAASGIVVNRAYTFYMPAGTIDISAEL